MCFICFRAVTDDGFKSKQIFDKIADALKVRFTFIIMSTLQFIHVCRSVSKKL